MVMYVFEFDKPDPEALDNIFLLAASLNVIDMALLNTHARELDPDNSSTGSLVQMRHHFSQEICSDYDDLLIESERHAYKFKHYVEYEPSPDGVTKTGLIVRTRLYSEHQEGSISYMRSIFRVAEDKYVYWLA